MNTILPRQVLAGILGAPAHVAEKSAQRLESADFETWTYKKIFTALTQCEFADHSEPGSLLIQAHRVLMAQGELADQDNGLRATINELAGVEGHPEVLPQLVDELIEQRFRRAVTVYGAGLGDYADGHPLDEVDGALRGIQELRRLRARINDNTAQLEVVREGGAA